MSTIIIRGRTVEVYYGGALVLSLHVKNCDDVSEVRAAIRRGQDLLCHLSNKPGKVCRLAAA